MPRLDEISLIRDGIRQSFMGYMNYFEWGCGRRDVFDDGGGIFGLGLSCNETRLRVCRPAVEVDYGDRQHQERSYWKISQASNLTRTRKTRPGGPNFGPTYQFKGKYIRSITPSSL